MLSTPLRVLAAASLLVGIVLESAANGAAAQPPALAQLERLPPVEFASPAVEWRAPENNDRQTVTPVQFLPGYAPMPLADDRGVWSDSSDSALDATAVEQRPWSFFRDGEWYFSWGANVDFWAPTNIHVSQPSLNNDFTVHNVKAHDEPGVDGVFSSQYNVRFGRFIGERRTWALEFGLDHTKYTSTIGQTAHVTGTINGAPFDQNVLLSKDVFTYKLHNGANYATIDLVKRVRLYRPINEPLSIAGIGKIGLGAMLPHPESRIFGYDSDVGDKTWSNAVGVQRGWWQLDGFTVGLEAGFRVVLRMPFYLEVTDKFAYASLKDVQVARGVASHDLYVNQIIVNLGVAYDGIHGWSRSPRRNSF
jgi:hypothetical protein